MPARIDGSPWSGDGDRATWQGERTKAQEASFLQRCVKKRRSKEGKFTSPEAMLKCPDFRASVLYVRGLRAPASCVLYSPVAQGMQVAPETPRTVCIRNEYTVCAHQPRACTATSHFKLEI